MCLTCGPVQLPFNQAELLTVHVRKFFELGQHAFQQLILAGMLIDGLLETLPADGCHSNSCELSFSLYVHFQ